jgi:hypothetical protein
VARLSRSQTVVRGNFEPQRLFGGLANPVRVLFAGARAAPRLEMLEHAGLSNRHADRQRLAIGCPKFNQVRPPSSWKESVSRSIGVGLRPSAFGLRLLMRDLEGRPLHNIVSGWRLLSIFNSAEGSANNAIAIDC